MSNLDDLLRQIAARLVAVEGVTAVVLGGSRATGRAHAGSDVDLGLYYDSQRPPSLAALNQLASELDDRHLAGLVTGFGEWGPWVNGGGWLEIGGYQVDWLYRDLRRVAAVIEACKLGQVTCDYQVGHPHGFPSHVYMGELHHARLLADPTGALAALQEQAAYPVALCQTLVQRFLFEAQFSLDIARKGAVRDDVAYVSGCLFRSVACLVQVLFAHNRRFVLNEKGALAGVDALPERPAQFGKTVRGIFARIGEGPVDLVASIDRLAAVVQQVRELCE